MCLMASTRKPSQSVASIRFLKALERMPCTAESSVFMSSVPLNWPRRFSGEQSQQLIVPLLWK